MDCKQSEISSLKGVQWSISKEQKLSISVQAFVVVSCSIGEPPLAADGTARCVLANC